MRMSEERREEIALERYRVIAPLLDSQLERYERRRLMRKRAEREGLSPNTVERWYKDYSRYGFKALFPKRRRDLGASRKIPLEVVNRASELLKENPRRSIARVIPFLELEFPMLKERIKRSTLSRLLLERGIS
ncbi:MAG TPA: helix-turn-helix domain-containing protein, partial [Candidatus Aenigmarchaeota archaeon]|nr:helix-turn-helix domain-containing protein [Candidatus Aenigmarchaeota archaeon]